MTPKERAQELVIRMHECIYSGIVDLYPTFCESTAVQSAIVCVDEILAANPSKIFYCATIIDTLYWQQVKEELLKM